MNELEKNLNELKEKSPIFIEIWSGKRVIGMFNDRFNWEWTWYEGEKVYILMLNNGRMEAKANEITVEPEYDLLTLKY